MTTARLPTPVRATPGTKKRLLTSGSSTFELRQLTVLPDHTFIGRVLACWTTLAPSEPTYYVLTQTEHPFLLFSPCLQHLTLRDAGLWPAFRWRQCTTSRLFELRTYTPLPGQLDALLTRFRLYTLPLFARHGITSVAYWLTLPTPTEPTKLVYLLSYANEAEARQQFSGFRADPDWQRVKTLSERNGPLHERVQSVFLTPAPLSPLA